MRIISKRTLRSYWEESSDAEQPLKSWYAIAAEANWATPHDVKATYGNASIVGADRVVFNIGGNKHRLIVRFDYSRGIGWFVRFVGPHREYDKVDASKV
ncbi:MAG: type II toxin-antitoxin system HigB family toxin [Gammaproteobacteria bacterium]|nr:type II toxin-antitoxin system HigB family toxin [Gammaproteobacteria bacterium]